MALNETLQVDLAQARRDVARFSQEITRALSLDPDTEQLRSEIEAAVAPLRELDGDSVKVRAEVDDSEVDDLAGKLERASGSTIDVTAEVDDSEVDATARKVEGLDSDASVRVGTEDSEVDATVRKVDGLDSEAPNVRVGTDDSEVDATARKIDDLDSEAVVIPVDVDDSDLDTVGAKLEGIAAGAGASFAAGFLGAVGAGLAEGFGRQEIRAGLRATFFNLEAEDFEQIIAAQRAIFEQGLPSDEIDIGRAVGLTFRAIDEFDESQAQLQQLAEVALEIEQAFGIGAPEAIRDASQVVRNDLAPSLGEAFDLIVEGYARTQGRGEDFGETINEFGGIFRSLGLTGADTLAILSAGLDAGAKDTDRVANAMLELSNRVVEDSDTIRAAISDLGLDENIGERIAAGGADARDAVFDILDAVAEVRDAGEQQSILVDLFGGPGEDLGFETVAALRNARDAVDDLDGTAERFASSSDSRMRDLRGLVREARSDFGALLSGDFGGASPLRIELDDVKVTLTDAGRASIVARDALNLTVAAADAAVGALSAAFSVDTEQLEAELGGAVSAVTTGAQSLVSGLDLTGLAPPIDFDLIISEKNAQEFAEQIETVRGLVVSAFGNPWGPRIEDEDIVAYVARFAEVQATAEDFSRNLLLIEASNVFTEQEESLLFDALEAAGGEGGAILAEQLATAIRNGDTDRINAIKSSLEAGARSAQITEEINRKVAAIDKTVGFTATLDDAQIRAIQSNPYFAEFTAVLDIDDSQVRDIEERRLNMRATLEIDEVTVDGEVIDFGFGDGDIPFFDKGGLVDHGGVYRHPAFLVAERPGHHEMVAGVHHTDAQWVGWMDELGVAARVQRELNRRMGPAEVFTVGAGSGSGSGVMAELAAMRAELAAIRADTGAMVGQGSHLEGIAGSTEAGARATQRLADRREPVGRQEGWRP